MISEINTTQFQQNPAAVLAQVEAPEDAVLIKEDGKPVAALVSMEMFTRMRQSEDTRRFNELREKLASGFADIPFEEGDEMILEAVRKARGR